MTSLTIASPDVLVARGGVVQLTHTDTAQVISRAEKSPRKRARLCTHPDAADALHEMMICLDRDTYIRPHRHAGKSESFHIIEGELTVVLFDDAGAVIETIEMGPYHTGMVFYYRLMNAAFHSVLVNTSQVLFHETTNGPFDPAQTEYAEWAPAEGDPDVAAYVDRLRAEAYA